MNDQTKDPLARWWWPGQWLHIVYGVWIDQLWYWQNVRPRLKGRTKGWGIWVQGMLGAAVVSLTLVALVGVGLSITGMQIKWEFLFLGTTIGIEAGIGLGILGLIVGTAYSMAIGIIVSICLGATFGVGGGLSGTEDMIFGTIQSLAFLGLVAPIALAIGLGVSKVVIEGSKWSILDSLFLVMLLFIGLTLSSSQTPKLDVNIAEAIAVSGGIYVSGRWATRQVPDNEIRKHLANPDKQDLSRRQK